MATGQEPPPDDETVIAEEMERAERGVAEARDRAARAGLAAARSLDESARFHERVAKVHPGDRRTGRIPDGGQSKIHNPSPRGGSRRSPVGRAEANAVGSRLVWRHRPVAISRTARGAARRIAAPSGRGGR
jgi:hypothetical protein